MYRLLASSTVFRGTALREQCVVETNSTECMIKPSWYLYKLLRFWWADEKVYLSCSCLRQAWYLIALPIATYHPGGAASFFGFPFPLLYIWP